MFKVDLKELLEAGSHFGHQTTRWNPKMRPYIFAAKDGVHIFDLAKTKEGLEEAAAYIEAAVAKGGKVLFLGTKKQAKEIVENAAKKAQMPYVIERWMGGTITNWEQIKRSIDKLADMKVKREAGEYKEYTKKEQLLMDREIIRLEKFFGGLSDLEKLPEVLFIVDVRKEFTAALEAKRRGVKVVAMVDTNGNPDLVDFVIPVNDDATKSIELVVDTISQAIEEGKESKTKTEAKETEKTVKKVKKNEK